MNSVDLSHEYNWRTDKEVAPGGYFDDLACHGLDLFAYLIGEYDAVRGVCLNQQQLYSSYDAISACWIHKNGITGTGSWNFGARSRQDMVVIYGSKGEVSFSIFDELPISVSNLNHREEIYIENPKNIQLYHVQNMRDHLFSEVPHPSNGSTAVHTSWVMDEILKNGV